MEVSGAARAPPHLTLAVPTTEYFRSTAILGTTTARTEQLGRRARRVFHPPHSIWSRGLHMLLLTLFGGAFVGSPGPCIVRVIADARPSSAGRPSPPPRPPAPCLHLHFHRSPRALLALPSAADGSLLLLPSTWSSLGSPIPPPPTPRGPALSAWSPPYTTATALPSAILAPLSSRSPLRLRRASARRRTPHESRVSHPCL